MPQTLGRAVSSALPLFSAVTLAASSIALAGPLLHPAQTLQQPVQGHHAQRHVKRNAAAGPIYFAGGGTVPSIAFLGLAESQAGAPNPSLVPGTGTSGSIFDYFVNTYSRNGGADQISYCQGSAGFGRNVMSGENENDSIQQPPPLPDNANLPCASPVGAKQVNQQNGFGAVGQDFGDFAGIDQISTSDYANWVSNAQTQGRSIFGRGLPVQVPYFIASVALLYDNDDPAVEASQLNISAATLCKIADGEITNWHQLNKKFASKTLSFAVRQDSAGASYSLSNHLNATCKGAGETYGVSNNYDEYIPGNPQIGALPNPLPPGATTQNFVTGNGNGGVIQAIAQTDGAIGYVEAASAAAATNGSSMNYALVAGRDPIKDLPASAALVKKAALLTSEGTTADVANGRAGLSQLSPADPCVLIVNPLAYATPPKKAYPIIFVVSLLLTQTGNGADAADLQSLAYMVSQASPEAVGQGRITTIDVYGKSSLGVTGYSTLDQKVFGKIVKQTATSCIGA